MTSCRSNGANWLVKKQRWQVGEKGNRQFMEVNKRLKRWLYPAADSSLILVVRWGSKPMEFERGKSAIAVADMAALLRTLDGLVTGAMAGELDVLIAAVNRQRVLAKRKVV